MNSNREKFDSLRTLCLPLGHYCITGSGPLGIRNMRKINDIDIIVTPTLWKSLSEIYGIFIKDGLEKIVLPNTCIEALCERSFKSEDAEGDRARIAKRIEQAEIIDSLPFDRLEYILFYKKNMRREKDLNDIRLIEELISSNRKQ